MKSSTTRRFREAFASLPDQIRLSARKQYGIWKVNPQHPSLHFKKVGLFWSVRVTMDHRALAYLEDETYYWFWIGNHADYDRLISGRN